MCSYCLDQSYQFDFFERVAASEWETFKSQVVLQAIFMVRYHCLAYFWHLHLSNTKTVQVVEGLGRKSCSDCTGRHSFVLIRKDRFYLASIVTFIKAVRHPLIQHEVHVIIRYVLDSMVRAPSTDSFHNGPFVIELVIILNLCDLVGDIGEKF